MRILTHIIILIVSCTLLPTSIYGLEQKNLTGDLWLEAPRLKAVAIRYSPEQNESDPNLLYSGVIAKVQGALELYPDINIIVLPERTFQDNQTLTPVEIHCLKNPTICTAHSTGTPASDRIVTALEALQDLARTYHTHIVIGTIYEQIPNPGNIAAIPGNYMYFTAVVLINDQGQIIGTVRKGGGEAGGIARNSDSGGCSAFLTNGQHWWDVVGQPQHPYNRCIDAVSEFVYETVPNSYQTITLNDGTQASYFVVICGSAWDQRTLSPGVEADILINSLAEGDWGWENKMRTIQEGKWTEESETENYAWSIQKFFFEFLVQQSGVIKKGGVIVAADSTSQDGGIIQLNTPPRSMPDYDITEDFVMGEIPIIQETATLTLYNESEETGKIQVYKESLGESPWEGVFTKAIQIPLSGLPQEGFLFDHWSGDTKFLDDISSCQTTVTLHEDTTINALFSNQKLNTPPVIQPIGDQIFDITRSLSTWGFQIQAFDRDCGPSSLTYSVQNLPAWATLNTTTGAISFSINSFGNRIVQPGIYNLRVSVSDGRDSSYRDVVMIIIDRAIVPANMPTDCNCDGALGGEEPGESSLKDAVAMLQAQAGVIPNCGWCCSTENICPAIHVDTISPVGTILINHGVSVTYTPSVTINLSATDIGSRMGSGAQMRFSNNQITWSLPEEYAATKTWMLLPGAGTKNVYVQFKDPAGNWSPTASDSISFEMKPDLTITNFSVELSKIDNPRGKPLTPLEGQRLYFTTTLKNQGSLNAGAHKSTFSVDGTSVISCNISNMLPGRSDTYTCGPWIAMAGPHLLNAFIDSENAIAESDETNNKAVLILTVVKDTAPPVISKGTPVGYLSAGTTQVNLGVLTNEDAVCKYDTVDRAYNSMSNTFSGTGTRDHSKLITGLNSTSANLYYVRCQDKSSSLNQNQTGYSIKFCGVKGDCTPPAVPQNLRVKAVSKTSITLAWNHSQDTQNKVAYRIYRNGVMIPASTTQATYTDTGLTPKTSYTYTITAYDSSPVRNMSAPSAPLSVKTLP